MNYILYGIGFVSDKNYFINFNNNCYMGDKIKIVAARKIDRLVNAKLTIKAQQENLDALIDIDTFTNYLKIRYQTNFSQYLCTSFENNDVLDIFETEITNNESIDNNKNPF